jgi:tRNA (Thr-GGU) A37 N-methylase
MRISARNRLKGRIVEVKNGRLEGPNLYVRGLDCLDGTPLIDLKPDRCAFTPLAPRQPGDDEAGD